MTNTKALDIDTDELLEAIQSALDNTDEVLVGFTSTELQELMGWSQYKTIKVIRMMRKKELIRAIFAKRKSFHGIEALRPAYELVKNGLTIDSLNDNM